MVIHLKVSRLKLQYYILKFTKIHVFFCFPHYHQHSFAFSHDFNLNITHSNLIENVVVSIETVFVVKNDTLE